MLDEPDQEYVSELPVKVRCKIVFKEDDQKTVELTRENKSVETHKIVK